MGKKKEPNVYAVSGGQSLFVLRKVRAVIQEAMENGYKIDRIDGSQVGELRKALSADNLFFNNPKTFVVISNPEEIPLNLVEGHIERGGVDTILLLQLDGNPDKRTKLGKFINGLKTHVNFPVRDKPWEVEEDAQRFCVQEAKDQKKELTLRLAAAITGRVGSDFGRIRFEIRKMVLLAEANGVDVIDGGIVGKSLAIIGEAETKPAVDALLIKHRPLLMRTLGRIKETSSQNPVIRIASAIEGAAYKWLSVVELREQGMSPENAALRLNKNLWYYKNKLLPGVVRWTKSEVIHLIEEMGGSQRAVLNGHVDSWTGFLVRLLRACR